MPIFTDTVVGKLNGQSYLYKVSTLCRSIPNLPRFRDMLSLECSNVSQRNGLKASKIIYPKRHGFESLLGIRIGIFLYPQICPQKNLL